MRTTPPNYQWLLALLFPAFLISCGGGNAPAPEAKVSKATTKDSFYMETPMGWTTELMQFPIDFAPGIPYKGSEHLRFAKGWGEVASEEHWAYAFTWWLDGQPVITENTLQGNLTEYYNGLVKRNVVERKIPAGKVIPTEATIKKMVTLKGDIASYTGIIKMLDYHSEEPMTLNCMIHVKDCKVKDHQAIVFLISPKPLDHSIWKMLTGLNDRFSCGN